MRNIYTIQNSSSRWDAAAKLYPQINDLIDRKKLNTTILHLTGSGLNLWSQSIFCDDDLQPISTIYNPWP